jgi:hypothetical protein
MGIIAVVCKENPLLFAGGYLESTAENLSVFEFNFKNGTIEAVSGTNAGPNPSYFCFSDILINSIIIDEEETRFIAY